MVFKKLVCFIYNHLIGNGDHLRAQPTFRETSSLLHKVSLDEVEVEVEVEVEGEVCCVCLSRLKKGQEEMRILPCLHEFHKICVDRWFNHVCRKTCPVCRFSMGGEDKFHTQQVLTDEMVIWFSSFHVAGF